MQDGLWFQFDVIPGRHTDELWPVFLTLPGLRSARSATVPAPGISHLCFILWLMVLLSQPPAPSVWSVWGQWRGPPVMARYVALRMVTTPRPPHPRLTRVLSPELQVSSLEKLSGRHWYLTSALRPVGPGGSWQLEERRTVAAETRREQPDWDWQWESSSGRKLGTWQSEEAVSITPDRIMIWGNEDIIGWWR